jgi:hypothetical protein
MTKCKKGLWTRLDDGEEAIVMGNLFDEDEW